MPCPDRSALARYRLGTLPDADSEKIERHLAQCAACVAAVGTVRSEDTLVGAMRSDAVTSKPAEGDVVEGLVSRLGAMRLDSPKPKFPFLSPPQAPGELGRFGRSRVLREIKSGSTGHVFEAEHTLLDRTYALKVMKAGKPDAHEWFLAGARAVAMMEGDHFVTLFEVAEEEAGLLYLLMELLCGESLADRLRGAVATDPPYSLPVAEAVRIAHETVLGLVALHERGFIHGRVKPGHIFLSESGERVKLLDPLGADGHPSRDVFGLGSVLYAMTTGGPPSLVGPHAKPASPRHLNRAVPQALSDLILRMLVPDPARRPTMPDVVTGLDAAAR